MTIGEAIEELQTYPLDTQFYVLHDTGTSPVIRFVSLNTGTSGAQVDDEGNVTYTSALVVACEFGDAEAAPE